MNKAIGGVFNGLAFVNKKAEGFSVLISRFIRLGS